MSVNSSTWHFARIMMIAKGRIFVNFRIRHFLLSLLTHYDFGLNRTKITEHTREGPCSIMIYRDYWFHSLWGTS